LAEDRLVAACDVWWPHLEPKLEEIERQAPSDAPSRSEHDLLEEILSIVRGSRDDDLRRVLDAEAAAKRMLDEVRDRENELHHARYMLDEARRRGDEALLREAELDERSARLREVEELLRLEEERGASEK
jgi:hypothetical protein